MTLCFALTLVCLDRCVDEFDLWWASRPTPEPEPELVPARTPRQVTAFIRSNVTVTRYGDRRRRTPYLPIPADSEDLILLTREAAEA
jgi:hypothetical protein